MKGLNTWRRRRRDLICSGEGPGNAIGEDQADIEDRDLRVILCLNACLTVIDAWILLNYDKSDSWLVFRQYSYFVSISARRHSNTPDFTSGSACSWTGNDVSAEASGSQCKTLTGFNVVISHLGVQTELLTRKSQSSKSVNDIIQPRLRLVRKIARGCSNSSLTVEVTVE